MVLAQAVTGAAEVPGASPAAPAAKPEPGVGATLLEGAKKHLEEKAAADEATEGEATVPELLGDGAKVYSDWKTAGWMGGLLALVSLLMNLLRFGPINEFFKVKKLMWLKPLLAGLFGGAAAGLTSAMSGMAVGASISAGLMAGLGAVGLYESVKRRKAENRQT